MPSSLGIELTSEAEDDLADIWRYTLERWDEEQADAYVDLLWRGLRRLSEFPHLGIERPELGPQLRSLPVERHSAIYHVTRRAIVVHRLLHERRAGPRTTSR